MHVKTDKLLQRIICKKPTLLALATKHGKNQTDLQADYGATPNDGLFDPLICSCNNNAQHRVQFGALWMYTVVD